MYTICRQVQTHTRMVASMMSSSSMPRSVAVWEGSMGSPSKVNLILERGSSSIAANAVIAFRRGSVCKRNRLHSLCTPLLPPSSPPLDPKWSQGVLHSCSALVREKIYQLREWVATIHLLLITCKWCFSLHSALWWWWTRCFPLNQCWRQREQYSPVAHPSQ